MIVSIDVGTSYSCICLKGKSGGVQPVDIATGMSMYGSKYSLPTAVFLDENGKLLLGQAAMNSRKKNPRNFKMEFKRYLGSNIPISLGEESFLPEELYTHIFIHLKNSAEKISGESVEKAYITYPAVYGKQKKEKIIKAAKDAGIFNVELIDEPTAAAMSYVADGSLGDNQNLMVYDFGGGTFDVSLIRYDGETFSLLTEPKGLEQCGGIDIDRRVFENIMSNVDEEFLKKLRGSPLNYMKYESQMSELAVKAKHHLSDAEIYNDDIPMGIFDSVPYSLTREEFNRMNAKLVSDTIDICHSALEEADLDVSDLAAVLMVGGTSRVPFVQESVKKFSGKVPVLISKDLELAVVSGAIVFNESKYKINKKELLTEEEVGEEIKEPEEVLKPEEIEEEIKEEVIEEEVTEIAEETPEVTEIEHEESEKEETVEKEEHRGFNLKIVPGRREEETSTVSGEISSNLRINIKKPAEKSVSAPWVENYLMYDKKIGEITEDSMALRCPVKRKDIITVTFVDSLEKKPFMAWDVSEKRNRSVMAWTTPNAKGHNLYIGAESGINAQNACKNLFSCYTNLESISFNGCFHIDYAEDISGMFDRCPALESIDTSGFDELHRTRLNDEFKRRNKVEKKADADASHSTFAETNKDIFRKVQMFIEKNPNVKKGVGDFVEKEIHKGRTIMGVPSGDYICLYHDDTVMQSGKNGYALTNSGIYVRELWSSPRYISWEKFKTSKIENGCMIEKAKCCYHVIGESKEYMNNGFFVELHEYLNK